MDLRNYLHLRSTSIVVVVVVVESSTMEVIFCFSVCKKFKAVQQLQLSWAVVPLRNNYIEKSFKNLTIDADRLLFDKLKERRIYAFLLRMQQCIKSFIYGHTLLGRIWVNTSKIHFQYKINWFYIIKYKI